MIPIPLIAAGITAAGSIGAAALGRRKNQETKMQKTKRELVDELIAGVKGGGSYSDLFNADYDTFQKSYVDPAKSIFNNQIAPQIQQQYVHSGGFGGSGMEDQLLRAGIDLDQMLNQQYGQFQENALNRKSNAINSILGQDAGAQRPESFGEAAQQGGAAYLSRSGFQDNLDSILDKYKTKQAPDYAWGQPRKGFAT